MTVVDTVKTAGSPAKPRGKKGDVLLEIRGLRIEGQSDEKWTEIVKGVDLTLRRGEVLGLIGESGAGKSTIGLAAMAYARPGCRISAGLRANASNCRVSQPKNAASGAPRSPMSPSRRRPRSILPIA
jgi:ABC-type glutathione transport system ATPase component